MYFACSSMYYLRYVKWKMSFPSRTKDEKANDEERSVGSVERCN